MKVHNLLCTRLVSFFRQWISLLHFVLQLYHGEWRKDMMWGDGEMSWPSGETYIGPDPTIAPGLLSGRNRI